MRAGKSNKNRPPQGPQTTAYSIAGKWQKDESRRLERLKVVGDSHKVSGQHAAFVKALERVLDEHDKLLKYCRLVVRCHENCNFQENVEAIRTYLVEELKIEP